MRKSLTLVFLAALIAAPAVGGAAVRKAPPARHASRTHHRRLATNARRPLVWRSATAATLAPQPVKTRKPRTDFQPDVTPTAFQDRLSSGVTASAGLVSTGAAGRLGDGAQNSAATSMHQGGDGLAGGKVSLRF